MTSGISWCHHEVKSWTSFVGTDKPSVNQISRLIYLNMPFCGSSGVFLTRQTGWNFPQEFEKGSQLKNKNLWLNKNILSITFKASQSDSLLPVESVDISVRHPIGAKGNIRRATLTLWRVTIWGNVQLNVLCNYMIAEQRGIVFENKTGWKLPENRCRASNVTWNRHAELGQVSPTPLIRRVSTNSYKRRGESPYRINSRRVQDVGFRSRFKPCDSSLATFTLFYSLWTQPECSPLSWSQMSEMTNWSFRENSH